MDTVVRGGRGAATRTRLIRVATELFAERGFDGTSIEAVLRGAGVSRGALYHHFAGKDDLFEAVFMWVEHDVGLRVRSAAAAATDSGAALRLGCVAWVRLAADPVVQRIVLIDAPSVLGWKRWREMEEAHALGLLKLGLQAIAEERRLDTELVDVFAHVLLASLNEIALLIAAGPDVHAALRTGEKAVNELLTRLVP